MNPFRELLNGAQAPSSRDVPIEFNPIQPMSEGAQQQSQGNDMVLSELQRLKERTLAFEEMLKGRVNQPQMQMPNVAPNKNAALLGGLAALIGALTGDKSAVPAFGQFAGGLQQNAQAKEQKLLQEQQMKMQAQAQKDKALGDLLGFQLEDAQNAYSRANAADVANRKAAKETADAEAERAYKIWQTKADIEGRTKIAGINNESQEKRAWLRSRGKANEVEALMQSLGLSEDAAINYVYDSELKAAQANLAKSNTSLADAKTKYTDALTLYYPQKFDFDKKKEEFKQWSATEGLRLRQAAESRMAAGGGQKVSYKFEDDPAWYSLETRLKNLDLENMSHDLQNVGYAEELKKAEGYQEGPTKQQLLKFYPEQIAVHSKRMQEIQKRRIAIRAEQLKREAEIMAAKQAGGGASRPFPRGVSQWDAQIQASAKRHGVDPELVKAVMLQESGGNARARSPVGAIGLMQLMPGTARGLGVNPNDPAQNIEGGVRYLAQQLKTFGGDVSKALAAYNAGPGAVKKYKGVPPYKETKHYVKTITSRYKGR